MKKILFIVILIFLYSGCVTVQDVPEPEAAPEAAGKEKSLLEEILPQKDASQVSENAKAEEPEGPTEKKGVIFSKSDFQGLLEARYVRFLLEDLEDPEHKFQLNFGEDSDQKTFPWEVKAVKPGYFFVELPAGRYRIVSVSIPVGSTQATENMNVALEVTPDAFCYVGTLKMIGTKEKIKLGGLPVIKPGFEYTLEVLDEREEGIEAFRRNYPNFTQDICINLMQAGPVAAEDKKTENAIGM